MMHGDWTKVKGDSAMQILPFTSAEGSAPDPPAIAASGGRATTAFRAMLQQAPSATSPSRRIASEEAADEAKQKDDDTPHEAATPSDSEDAKAPALIADADTPDLSAAGISAEAVTAFSSLHGLPAHNGTSADPAAGDMALTRMAPDGSGPLPAQKAAVLMTGPDAGSSAVGAAPKPVGQGVTSAPALADEMPANDPSRPTPGGVPPVVANAGEGQGTSMQQYHPGSALQGTEIRAASVSGPVISLPAMGQSPQGTSRTLARARDMADMPSTISAGSAMDSPIRHPTPSVPDAQQAMQSAATSPQTEDKSSAPAPSATAPITTTGPPPGSADPLARSLFAQPQTNPGEPADALRQATLAVRSLAPGVTEIRLDPPHLGQLRLDLRTNGVTATLLIEAEQQQTLDLIRHGLHSLTAELRGLGYERVDIMLESSGRSTADPGTDTEESARQPPDETPEPPSPPSSASPDHGPAGAAEATPPGHAKNAGLDLRL